MTVDEVWHIYNQISNREKIKTKSLLVPNPNYSSPDVQIYAYLKKALVQLLWLTFSLFEKEKYWCKGQNVFAECFSSLFHAYRINTQG